MFRSLHIKLVLIMVLLVVSLMTVAGAFLINSVSRFYLNQFYSQMADVFSGDTAFFRDLSAAKTSETDEQSLLEGLGDVLDANMGALGVDGRNRNYFILSGADGSCLAASNESLRNGLELSSNIVRVLRDPTQAGFASSITARYMDVAIPVTRGGTPYIVYILDNRQTVQELTGQMFVLIIEALGFGLLISILLSFLLSKTMVIPIQRLTESAKRMAGGDFAQDITVDSRDEIGVLTSTFTDMAGQLKETLQTVENERTKLDALFLHMTDGLVAFNRKGRVIHSNPAAEELLGRTIPLGGSLDYDGLFGFIAPLHTVLEAENDCIEGDMLQGALRLHLLLAPFAKEEQAGCLVVIHDVTQQMKTEELRREFVANVSHELRTPLTNIRSYAETLSENADLPEEMRAGFFQVILNESDRMTHIVQDLLTLSRYDSGQAELQLTLFSVEDALRDLYQAVKLEAERRGHTLTLTMEEHLPPVRADRERLAQVIVNVVSNAIKYTADGGTISLRAGHEKDILWIEVADNGIGIPPQDRSRIFDRFYRVDKARSRESGGTGLGLSIAKEIMNRHEGKLLLVDRPGPGTTIRLELRAEETAL